MSPNLLKDHLDNRTLKISFPAPIAECHLGLNFSYGPNKLWPTPYHDTAYHTCLSLSFWPVGPMWGLCSYVVLCALHDSPLAHRRWMIWTSMWAVIGTCEGQTCTTILLIHRKRWSMQSHRARVSLRQSLWQRSNTRVEYAWLQGLAISTSYYR